MKIIGLILTYNCENLFRKHDKIPNGILDEIICSDDESSDNTKQVV